MWFNLVGEGMNILELIDYVECYLVDWFFVLDGVVCICIGGG